ncbi:MAG: LLM class flavin-dependent oxidoreductase [Nitrospinota bacterium]
MKFSVQLPTCTEGLVNPIPFARPEDFISLAREAERLGYDAVWGNDHVTPVPYVRQKYPDPPNFYEVLITLAAVGARTERIRLGTAVLVMPVRDPVLVARQAATLDRLTGGRLILGIGIGAYREEFLANRPRLGAARRGDLLDEGLAALRVLLTERDASFEGRHIAFRGIALRPKPVQDPFPIYVGGHNVEAVRRAATYGQGWLPGWRPFHEVEERVALLRRFTEEAGREPSEVEAAVQFTVYLGKTPEEAKAGYGRTGMVAHRKSLAHTGRDPALAAENNLIGSPASVLEQLAFLERAGVDHITALQFPSHTVEEMREQMEWLAEEVVAPFRGRAGA